MYDVFTELLACGISWFFSMKFNSFLHPNEHAQRIFLYLVKRFEGMPLKNLETKAGHSLANFGTINRLRGEF